MSNEYLDCERDIVEYDILAEQKQVIAKYPFLRVRDIDGTIDTEAEFPMMCLEIPSGWAKLFYQMCSDIKPILEKEGLLDDFYFVQVKEKYNYLVCHSSGEEPAEVSDIIQKYEQMAHYVCTCCGKPATLETRGYFASFCESCGEDHRKHSRVDDIKFEPSFEVWGFRDGAKYNRIISFENEWNRYIEEHGYDRTEL